MDWVEQQKLIRDSIERENAAAIDESTWGKPASDIITGLESMEKAEPARAIWEMVQNARDVSQKKGADIYFTLKDSEFQFKHNGLPFTTKTLHSLNIQTSSKVRDDIVQVGQYGTGFLTTHKFGLKFNLSGSLFLEDLRKYYDFSSLSFDRSSHDKVEMIKCLKDQQRAISELVSSEDGILKLKDITNAPTIFSYKQEHDVERERAEIAFKSAPDMTPHVLALNELVNSITYTDERNNQIASFVRHEKVIIESNFLYSFSMVETEIHRNFDEKGYSTRDYKYQIFLLESSEQMESIGSKVTIILPLMKEKHDETEEIRVFRFRKNKSNFFIYLPLLGTENWGVNFIFHSPLFSCADESRSGLRFVGNGQNNDFQADSNRELVNLGEKMIFSFIKSHLCNFSDRKMFSFVNFNTNIPNIKIADYYKEKQKYWVEKMSNYDLVSSSDNIYVKPSSIKGLCESLVNECYNNKKLLDSIYNILSVNYKSFLPAKNELLFWSDRFREWYGEEASSHYFTIDDLVQIISSKKSVSENDRIDILVIDRFLSNNQLFSYFENYAIIPNEAGILKKKEFLTCPTSFNMTTRKVMSVLIPEDYEKFVDADFANLTQFNPFTEDELKTKISSAISSIQTEQKTHREKFKRYSLRKNYSDNSNYEHDPHNFCLESKIVDSLIRFASMIIRVDSQSENAKILHLAIEHKGFNETINDTLYGFDPSSTCRTLIQNVLYDFSTCSNKTTYTNVELIRRAVKTIYSYSDLNSILREYAVYPNQKGEYKYSEQLKKENQLPDRLKDIYDLIVNENKGESIKDILLSKDYSDVFIDQSECLGTDIAAKLFEKISSKREGEYKSYPDISSYSHKSEVLEIIRRMDESEEGRIWSTLFSTLEKDKATVTMSIIDDGDKKSSIFKIMQEEDTSKLKVIADITEKIKDNYALNVLSEIADSKELTSILITAKRMNEERKESERQFNFKYAIGKLIEEELRRLVSSELSCTYDTVDCQNGQDIVISYKGEPIYYLESKAKWNFDEAAHMSSQQIKKSVSKKGKYALLCVDCTTATGATIPLDSTKDDVIASSQDIISHTYVHTNIGEILSPAISPLINEENSIDDGSKIRVYGELQSYIPKKYFVSGIPFKDFLIELCSKLHSIIIQTSF